ncbi:MAG TPA: tetratricopeptide repeat protein [Myxococcales bacterium]|nr:tetratricopeptide repeat protein [Myxococcales bacterium]
MRALRFAAVATLLCVSASAFADDPNEVQAKARFTEGETALRLGHYLDAIEAFEDSYRLSNKVEILYNIGLAYRRAYSVDGRPEYLRRALDIYRTFFKLARSPAEKRAAQEVITELSPQIRAIDDQERLARLRAQSTGPLAPAIRLYSEGHAPEAVQTLEALLHRGRNPPSMVADIYRLEGEMANDAQAPQVAEDAFRKLLSLDPDFQLPANATPAARASLEHAKTLFTGQSAVAVSHVVPPPATPDQPLSLSVGVDNDPMSLVARISVWYRHQGARRFSSVSRVGGGDLVIPGLDLPGGDQGYRVEYFVTALDRWGNVISSIGSVQAPLSFPVLSTEEVQRIADAQRPWYKRPWPWILISVGAVAVGGATYYAATRGGPPTSDWGVIQTLNR